MYLFIDKHFLFVIIKVAVYAGRMVFRNRNMYESRIQNSPSRDTVLPSIAEWTNDPEHDRAPGGTDADELPRRILIFSELPGCPVYNHGDILSLEETG
jgi:hypothetical protein